MKKIGFVLGFWLLGCLTFGQSDRATVRFEDIRDANGSGPNASDGVVDWTQIKNMPSGFEDGTDDGTEVLDEDDFSSNSATQPPSQQSVEARIDTKLAALDSVNIGQSADTATDGPLENDHSWSGIVRQFGDAGETVTFGKAVYWDYTDNEYKLCQPTSAETMAWVGICVNESVTDGNPLSYVNDGALRDDTYDFATTGPLYVIADGVLTNTKPTTEGHYFSVIARPNSADVLVFDQSRKVYHVPVTP